MGWDSIASLRGDARLHATRQREDRSAQVQRQLDVAVPPRTLERDQLVVGQGHLEWSRDRKVAKRDHTSTDRSNRCHARTGPHEPLKDHGSDRPGREPATCHGHLERQQMSRNSWTEEHVTEDCRDRMRHGAQRSSCHHASILSYRSQGPRGKVGLGRTPVPPALREWRLPSSRPSRR